MKKLPFNQSHAGSHTPLQSLAKSVSNMRLSLLFVAVFSLINVLMLIFDSFNYFLFSASIPYILTDFGKYFCGLYPEEFYEGGYEAYNFYDSTVFYIALFVALAFIAVYMLAYFFSKKNPFAWFIVGLSIFVIDTAVMLEYYEINMGLALDLFFHIYVIVTLSIGIKSSYQLKKLAAQTSPETDGEPQSFGENSFTEGTDEPFAERENSKPIRLADLNQKSRTLLEATVYGHAVIYRRVGKTNELVIDGWVYDEYTALLEFPHMLSAFIDGHEIAAGMDGKNMSFITCDMQTVAEKIRVI